MTRILIADDEPFIRNCLGYQIDWAAEGVQVAGVCKNGREVLNLMQQQPADIVVTDIKMPGMDGIELLRILREEYPDTHVIIISGYEEFEYAKRAIDYHADAYLIKPIHPEELRKRVRESAERIQSSRGAERLDDKAMLNMAIRGDFPNETLDSSQEAFQKLDACFYGVACIAASGKTGAILAWILERVENASGDVFSFRNVNHANVLLVRGESEDAVRRRSRSAARQAADMLEDAGIENYAITVSNPARGFESIIMCLDEAQRMQALYRSGADERIVFRWNRKPLHSTAVSEEIEAVLGAMRDGDAAAARAALRSMMAALPASLSAVQMADLLLYAMMDRFPSVLDDDRESIENLILETRLCTEFSKLQAHLEMLIDQVLQRLNRGGEDSTEVVREAKRYIDRNLSRPDLSLNLIARQLNHNASYLCALFSKDTGITLTGYIMAERIRRAQKLIADNDMRLSEVAEAVGYSDYNYFRRIFKRLVKMTPSEYRASLSIADSAGDE